MSEKVEKFGTHVVEEKELIIKLLRAMHPGIKIYLYGSRARKTHHDRSDIDLALDAGRELSRLDMVRIKGILDGLWIPQGFDAVDIHAISEDFKNRIKRDFVEWTI